MKLKGKNKVISLLLSFVMILGLFPAAAFAAEGQGGNFGKNGGNNVTWTLDTNGKLTIEGYGETESIDVYNGSPWWDNRKSIKSVVVNSTISQITPTSTANWFYGCSMATSIDLSGLDTSNVTDMNCMFCDCGKLKSLDLSGFNTSNVKDMTQMFESDYQLESLDLSNFDTSNVTDMMAMFEECRSLVSVNLSSFDTSRVTSMVDMFYDSCALKDLDISNFNTSSLGNDGMAEMFGLCSSLESLTLPKRFGSNNTESYENLFAGCSSLKSLDLSGLISPKVCCMKYMFAGCSNLTSLDISSLNTSKAVDMGDMFIDCDALARITIGDTFSFFGNSSSVKTKLPDNGFWWYSSETGKIFTADDIASKRNNTADSYQRSPVDVIDVTPTKPADKSSEPDVVIKRGETALVNGTDYDLDFSYDSSNGGGTMHITFKNVKSGYTGALDVSFNGPVYEITLHPDWTWNQGNVNGLEVDANGAAEKLTGIIVDGNVINSTDYTINPNTGALMLLPKYLETLLTGTHTLSFQYIDGHVNTTFTVNPGSENLSPENPNHSNKPGAPQTGDEGCVILWMILCIASAIGIGCGLIFSKKRKISR